MSSEDKPGGQNVAHPFSVSNTHPHRFPSCTDDSFDIMNVVNAAQIRAMLGFKSRAALSNLLQGYGCKKNNAHMRIEANKQKSCPEQVALEDGGKCLRRLFC